MKIRLLITLTLVVWTGCAGKRPPATPAAPDLPRLGNLQIAPADRELTLTWDVERRSDQVFSGYHVYITPEPLPVGTSYDGLLSPYTENPFPGDTDGDPSREAFEVEDLQNGVRYYCFVRPVGVNGEPGPGTPVREAICRPGGEAALQSVFSGDRDGFDFARGRYVDTDADECHIAFYVKEGKEQIVSPSRIEPLVGETRFWDLGTQPEFDAVTAWTPTGKGATQVAAARGHLYVFQTPSGNYGKFWITGIADEDGERTIRFRYMYQTIPQLVDLR